jgi:hypothetical protein
MLPWDKGTRDLLPLMQADPGDSFQAEAEFAGAPAPMDAPAPPTSPADAPSVADLMPQEHQEAAGRGPVPIKSPHHAPATSHASGLTDGDSEHVQVASPSPIHIQILNFEASNPVSIVHGQGGSVSSHQDDQDHTQGGSSLQDAGQAPQSGATPPADADVHTIKVSQDADVVQDASIIVNGYAGKVVARLHIDQDLMMDQDVDIEFTIDGDGHFSVLLDQDMRIDQEVDIDIKIFDQDGTLYVDVFLQDRISVEQDTTLHMEIDDGPPGGTVEIDQTLEMDQDVDININIEDELEERYIVKVDVDVQQDADADQGANVDITSRNGEIDMDVDAFQTASIDQDTTVRIDFAAV